MSRMMFLLYGMVSYGIFFATFLYAIGFVNGLVVPTSLDAEPTVPLGQALITNLLLLSLFAVQHSVMARPAFKRWWVKFIPEPIERSTFVLLASACLILLFWKWQPMGGTIWSVESPVASTVLTVISLLGFFIVLISTFLINHFDLFGLRQVYTYFIGKEYEPLAFRTPGIYKSVRHPIYMGFMIAFWSTPHMTMAHLVFAIMTTAYMLVGIQLEERDLIRHFGSRYLQYKTQVPMLNPFRRMLSSSPRTTAVPAQTGKETVMAPTSSTVNPLD